MKFFVIGGSGFLGTAFLKELLRSDETEKIYCLIHHSRPQTTDKRIFPISGSVSTLDNVQLPEKIDVCVDIAGVNNGRGVSKNDTMEVNYGGVKAAIQFCQKKGIAKIILVSSVNVNLTQKDVYAKSKCLAEGAVKKSGLNYLIFRPALIYGHGVKAGLGIIERAIQSFGIVPVFGDGKKLEQPIHVDECAAFMAYYCLANCTDHVIELYGNEPMCYNELCMRLAAILGKKARLLHIPVWIPVAGLKILEFLHIRFPVSLEQIYHIDSDLSGDMSGIYQETGISGLSIEAHYKQDLTGR